VIENLQRTDTIEFLFSKVDFGFAHFTMCAAVLLVSTQRIDMFKVCVIISKASFIRESQMFRYPAEQSQITHVICFLILSFPGLRNDDETNTDPSGVIHDTITSGNLNLSVTSFCHKLKI